MSRVGPQAQVSVTPKSMWRIRLARELPRYLLQALAIVGLLASARFAIAPPRPILARSSTSGSAVSDRAAEGFATLFARAYLDWDSRDPEAHRLALAPFVGSWMEGEAGLQPPEDGEQQVQWTQIVQVRHIASGEFYTVAAQTDTAGLLYLSVGVAHEADGALALAGYPAFVGAPTSTAAAAPAHLREVEEPALATVVTRALRNYLARAESELDADLAAGARVSLPEQTLTLQSLDSLDWSASGRSVVATLRARDERGGQYTLAYELGVRLSAGRWEISAIQTNPSS
ncbi:MAG TPA: conjugal transfer protein [Solirubrobacteraceae bacterium]|nr:conjugal transfer protein [Solirubrobacteraceae bacterium]